MICHLLAHRKDIGEVILYEAADWLYFLPLSDPDLCGHGFLDLPAYDAYLSGQMVDNELSDASLAEAMATVPVLA